MRIQLIQNTRYRNKYKVKCKERDPPDCSAVEVILSVCGVQTSMEI